MLRVAIRADASTVLGTGHLRRCLSLARALAACGVGSEFLVRDDEVAQSVLRDQPFPVRWLGQVGDDAAQSAAALGAQPPDWLLVDHYRLGADWHEAVRSSLGCRIAVVDDLANRLLAPDLLIDPNDDAAAQTYAPLLARPCKVLGGPRFALLDPLYADAPRYRFHEAIGSIGIFMGGTDPHGHCLAALRAVRHGLAFAGPVEVVCPPSSPHHAALAQDCARWPGTTLVDGLPDLAAFFARHDVQIGAGGGAVWERCCIGVPTVACVIAENQLSTVPRLEAAGAVAWAREGQGVGAEAAIVAQLQRLAAQPALRRSLGEAAARLADGLGSARVAAVLACAAGAALSLRPAQAQDERLLLDWANDPEVRSRGFHPQPVAPKDHARWFALRLADGQGCRIAIVQAPNGLPVGQVRLERRQAWEIGYSVAAEFRGLGLAAGLLEQAIGALPADGLPVLGRVRPDNEASARVFRRLGFSQRAETGAQGEHLVFSRERPRGDNRG